MDQDSIIAKKDQIIAQKDAQIARLLADNARITQLEAELTQLKRLIFGQKSERFIPDSNSAQMALDLGVAQEQPQEDELEKISYERKKGKKKNGTHPGRKPLPSHLRREERIIEPDLDTTDMLRIGEEVTETLQYKAAELYVLREIRPKFLEKRVDQTGTEHSKIHIAPQPERPLPKTIAGVSLLSHILVSKYLDHLPLYRQRKIFTREGVRIPTSTLSDWVASVCDLLEPLYQLLRREVLKQIYLMADESRIQVLDSAKKGKSHRGFMWVCYAPLVKLVLFDYQQGRTNEHGQAVLSSYQGFLQTDGYPVYDSLFEKNKQVELLSCMAHARRYFEKALQNDKEKASHAMSLIQELYKIERQAKEQQISFEERKKLRQDKALSILNALKSWAIKTYPEVLPKSSIGKALEYYLKREEKLRIYTQDGRLEIDNNLVENSIRPLALGRKNYLFAGSHKGAERAAMIYSFLGSCQKLEINPGEWLSDTLEKIAQHPVNKLEQFLPSNWEKTGKGQDM